MQLKYRGVIYNQSSSVIETTEGAIGGKFRGQEWKFRSLKTQPVLVQVFDLTYRGVSYNHSGTHVQTQEGCNILLQKFV